MPTAQLTISYLSPPFNRKIDFQNALMQSLASAGFPATNTDVFDITDGELNQNAQFGTPSIQSTFQAGGAGSRVGFVKELSYAPSPTGTLGLMCYTRPVLSSTLGGGGRNNPVFSDTSFLVYAHIFHGGWNSTTKRPASTNDSKIIGSLKVGFGFGDSVNNGISSPTYSIDNGDRGSAGMPIDASSIDPLRNLMCFRYTAPIKFTSINHPEIRGVWLEQVGRVPYFLGIVKPANPPNWWNEATFPYAFLSIKSCFFSLLGFSTTASPFNSTINSTYTVVSAGLGNNLYDRNHPVHSKGYGFTPDNSGVVLSALSLPPDNKRELFTGPSILSDGVVTSGIATKRLCGKFSNDIGVCLSHGLSFGDRLVVSPGTEEYMIINTTITREESSLSATVSTDNAYTSPSFPAYSIAIRVV